MQDAKGRFIKGCSGNPNGRPRKPEIEELRVALDAAKRKNKKSFIQHFVERAYKDDQIAIALARKILPDLSGVDIEEIKKDLRPTVMMPTVILSNGKPLDVKIGDNVGDEDENGD